MKKKITVYLRYGTRSASVRQRILEYEKKLNDNNIFLEKKILLNNKYFIEKIINQKILFFTIFFSVIKRIFQIIFQKKVDLILIQGGELLPYLPNILERIIVWKKIPYIVDIDDAFFSRYNDSKSLLINFFLKNKFSFIFKNSVQVFAGSKYLMDSALHFGAKSVVEIPTGVNCFKYDQLSLKKKNNLFSIIWIGSPSTTKCIVDILPALKKVCLDKKTLIRLVGAKEIQTDFLPLESFQWSELDEVPLISECHLGIMPLTENPWEKGKCGFKIIQYFACGLPVIASPIGANNHIVDHGVNGFLANNIDEWVKYINYFKNNPEKLKSFGIEAKKKANKLYSTNILQDYFFKNILKNMKKN